MLSARPGLPCFEFEIGSVYSLLSDGLIAKFGVDIACHIAKYRFITDIFQREASKHHEYDYKLLNGTQTKILGDMMFMVEIYGKLSQDLDDDDDDDAELEEQKETTPNILQLAVCITPLGVALIETKVTYQIFRKSPRSTTYTSMVPEGYGERIVSGDTEAWMVMLNELKIKEWNEKISVRIIPIIALKYFVAKDYALCHTATNSVNYRLHQFIKKTFGDINIQKQMKMILHRNDIIHFKSLRIYNQTGQLFGILINNGVNHYNFNVIQTALKQYGTL